jgi:hypothetical protein
MSVAVKPLLLYRNRRLSCFLLWLLLCLVTAALLGCAEERRSVVTSASDERSDCVGCHADKAMIVATAEEDTTTSGGDSGEG